GGGGGEGVGGGGGSAGGGVGNAAPGNQCSTTTRLPTAVQRSTRSSWKVITTEPPWITAMPSDLRCGSSTEASPPSPMRHTSVTPLVNSTVHLPLTAAS